MIKPLLSKFAAWKKSGEEEEFVDKAIDSLYKKLKTKPGAIEELQRVMSCPNQPSQCVTIPRSLDGRLQVSHRKGLPHVIYCRIFRWPDLQSHHELKAIDSCTYSFNSKQSEVCINPFHYERIEIPILPPVLVPRHAEFSQGQSVMNTSNNKSNIFNQNVNSNGVYQSPISNYAPMNSDLNKENYTAHHQHHQQQQQHSFTSSSSTTYNNAYAYHQHYQQQPQANLNHQTSNYTYNTFYNNQSASSYASSNNSGSPQTPLVEDASNEQNNLSNMSPTSSPYACQSTMSFEVSPSFQQSETCLNWCSIVYYELNNRIGEIFHASSTDVFIDGYTNPCSNYGRRFCLGMFTNVNRNATIENCRKHIGRGVHVYNDNGDVYVECLSDASIFIQSRNCNYDHSFHPNTVCKLPSGYSLRIFQSKLFAELLRDAISQGYDSVYDLANMCVIKLSFVKGWGADYYRQDVSSCPCWIEIRLNSAFQWLDKILKELGSSSNPATSVS